jgi:hypothetical protein
MRLHISEFLKNDGSGPSRVNIQANDHRIERFVYLPSGNHLSTITDRRPLHDHSIGYGLFLLRVFLRLLRPNQEIGGAEEDRTPDLLRARQALSQLSYGPWQHFPEH